MLRREKRLGIVYIENNKERNTTFSKRRNGLYKRANDLSVLTGARVAVILENNNGNMHSFGTPSVEPIADAFLSEGPPIEPFIDEAKNARVASLHTEVNRVETDNARMEERVKLSLQHIKNIQEENPGMIANHIFSKEEDLSLEDLNKIYHELMRFHEDIKHRLPPLNNGHGPNIDGPTIPQNLISLGDPSWDRLKTIHSSSQLLASHHPPPQVFPQIIVPTIQQHTWEPHFPIHVPQIFKPTSTHLALQSTSLLQPIYEQVQELPTPLQPHLQNYENPYNIV
uniref:Uncharacterized protein n=1 Tax=Avena sativa TaxID=4498 RepID=A0ACD5V236_AVESA